MDGRYRWEFRLRPDERPEDIDHDKVLELIRPWLAGQDVDKLTFLRQATYTFRALVADRWRNGPVFLLGDAAHQTPPFIGQGMCAGIRDAANLGWKLALVVHGDADERLLDTYEAERRPHARRMIRLAILIGWLMTGGSERTAATRRAALSLAGRIPGATTRMLPMPTYGEGPLVRRRRRDAIVGRPCPQPRMEGALLDDLMGDGFAIVYRGRDGTTAYDPPTRAFFDRLGTTAVCIDGLRDDGGFRRLLDEADVNALLVRPDRIVAAAGDTADLRAWQRHLRIAGIDPADVKDRMNDDDRTLLRRWSGRRDLNPRPLPRLRSRRHPQFPRSPSSGARLAHSLLRQVSEGRGCREELEAVTVDKLRGPGAVVSWSEGSVRAGGACQSAVARYMLTGVG